MPWMLSICLYSCYLTTCFLLFQILLFSISDRDSDSDLLFLRYLKDKALNVDVEDSVLQGLEEEKSLVDKANLLELNKK